MDTKLVEEAYGFRIKDIRNIKNVSRIETDCGVKCLKRAHMSTGFFLFIYSALNHLLEKGYDPRYGARPLRRTIQKYIEDELTEQFLLGKFQPGTSIVADVQDGRIQFR